MEKSARCGFLLARLSPSQCQPTALGSADLAYLPACFRRTAARRRSAGQTSPIRKSPALALECRGVFCSALMGGMPEGCFPFPHQLTQKVENSPLCGLLPGAGGLLTDPLVADAPPQGGAAPGKLPPSENPRHSHWNAGDFSVSIIAAVPGVTSTRRSHGLPL